MEILPLPNVSLEYIYRYEKKSLPLCCRNLIANAVNTVCFPRNGHRLWEAGVHSVRMNTFNANNYI